MTGEALITLEINGETRTMPTVASLGELLHNLGVGPDRIAVEVNRRIIRRKDWDTTAVSGGERIEIVQFVGGG